MTTRFAACRLNQEGGETLGELPRQVAVAGSSDPPVELVEHGLPDHQLLVMSMVSACHWRRAFARSGVTQAEIIHQAVREYYPATVIPTIGAFR